MIKECKWTIKEAADPQKVERLCAEVGIDRVLADLLVKIDQFGYGVCLILDACV